MHEPLLPEGVHARTRGARGGGSAPEPMTSSSGERLCISAVTSWVLRWLRYWWRVTTDVDYLKSGVSRRASFKMTIPACVICSLVVDTLSAACGTGKWLYPLIDLPFVAAACAYSLSSISASNLMTDFVLGLTATAGFALCIASADAGRDDSQFELVLAWFPTTLVIVAFAGFHSLVVAWLWVLSVATWYHGLELAMPAASSPSGQWATLTSTLVVWCYVAVEFALASLHHKWQVQRRCNETLLETVTDGFGTVDCATGVVLSASSKLLQSMGSSLVVGQVLGSAGALNDKVDSQALATFLGDAEAARLPQAVLVTWVSAGFEFEGRMVPFHVEGSEVGFCVQQVGEKRLCHLSAEETPRETPGVAPAAASRRGTEAAAEANQLERSPNPSASEIGQGLHLRRLAKRSLGTLSLSSWSLSCDGAHNLAGDGAAAAAAGAAASKCDKKKVEMRTQGVQVEPPKLPAPLSASSAPREGQVKALQKKRLSRACKARVQEGKAHLEQFDATPGPTRGNALRQLVSSFNVDGKGCCSRHIAWMGVQELVTQELLVTCGPVSLFTEWQCPDCGGLNNFDTFPPMEDAEDDEECDGQAPQLCALCHDLVQPTLPAAKPPAPLCQRLNGVALASSDVEAGSLGNSPSSSDMESCSSSSVAL